MEENKEECQHQWTRWELNRERYFAKNKIAHFRTCLICKKREDIDE